MTKKIRPLALNLRSVLAYKGATFITKEDILPQDMSFQDEKLKRLNKMMKKHPGRNRDWDPEIKHANLAVVEDIKLDPTTSRQVRRQLERLEAKAHNSRLVRFAKGKKELEYNERVVRIEHPETGMIRHGVAAINRPTLTLVTTGRYKPHQGLNARYYPIKEANGKSSILRAVV